MKKFKLLIITLYLYLVRFKNWIIFKYYWNKRKIQFSVAKKKADTMHHMTGRKYYVVPVGKRLQVVTGDVIKVFNKNTKRSMTNYDLLKMSYYATKIILFCCLFSLVSCKKDIVCVTTSTINTFTECEGFPIIKTYIDNSGSDYSEFDTVCYHNYLCTLKVVCKCQ